MSQEGAEDNVSPVVREPYKSVDKCTLRVEVEMRHSGEAAKRIYAQLADVEVVRDVEEGMAVTVSYGEEICSARLRVGRTEGSTAKIQSWSKEVCPRIKLCESVEFDIDNKAAVEHLKEYGGRSRYSSVSSSRMVGHPEWTLRVTKCYLTDMYSCELDMGEGASKDDRVILQAIRWLHSMFTAVVSMSQYVHPDIVTRCRSIQTTVRDKDPVKNDKMLYRIRVDGETVWVIDGGTVCYVCRPDSKLSVTSWYVKHCIAEFKPRLVDIIRCEQILDGTLVYIALLAQAGATMNADRNYMPADIEIQRIRVRPPMRTEYVKRVDAEVALVNAVLPADGIVAMDTVTRVTSRIKEPTVDLLCSNDRLVSPAYKGTMISFQCPMSLDEGEVYECRLSLVRGGAAVSKVAIRSDKSKPNKYEMTEAIISKVEGREDNSLINAKFLSDVSFAARDYIYNNTSNAKTTGSLVIDIGSGRMEAYSVMKRDTAYLLWNPHLDVSHQKSGSKFSDATMDDEVSLLQRLKRMDLGAITGRTSKRPIGDLLRHSEIMEFMVSSKIPVVFSFSISHTLKGFNALADAGTHVVGCSFFYDSVGRNGKLIDVPGIKMSKTRNANLARVETTNDGMYEEYPVRLTELSTRVYAAPSVQIIPWISRSPKDVVDAMQKVYIASS